MRRSHGPRRKARAGMNKERIYRDISSRDFDACPRPDKRVFVGRREAEAAAKASRKLGLPKWTYLCACGRWHLTKRRPHDH